MKVLVDYPSAQEEFVIVERMTGSLQAVKSVVNTDQLIELRKDAASVYVDPALIEYAVRLASATREPDKFGIRDVAKYIMYGTSPRASINLIITARALAYVRGRAYVLPQDILDMAFDVMRHRLVLSYEAMSDNITADMILDRIIKQIPLPSIPLQTHVNLTADAQS
jgi:MoxR-like ATPase